MVSSEWYFVSQAGEEKEQIYGQESVKDWIRRNFLSYGYEIKKCVQARNKKIVVLTKEDDMKIVIVEKINFEEEIDV